MTGLEIVAERIANLTETEIAGVILVVMAVIQSIKVTFNMTNKIHVYLLTILISLCGYTWLLFKGNVIVDSIGLFIIIIGGASGIYNFIPTGKVNKEVYGEQTPILIDEQPIDDYLTVEEGVIDGEEVV